MPSDVQQRWKVNSDLGATWSCVYMTSLTMSSGFDPPLIQVNDWVKFGASVISVYKAYDQTRAELNTLFLLNCKQGYNLMFFLIL